MREKISGGHPWSFSAAWVHSTSGLHYWLFQELKSQTRLWSNNWENSKENPQTWGPEGPGTAQHWIMSTCLYIGSVFSLNSFFFIHAKLSAPPPMHLLSNYSNVCIKGIKMRCLQVPGWRAQNCWPDFSSCCCCYCCFPHQCSRCCRRTSSVSVAYLALVLPAQLQRKTTFVLQSWRAPVKY